MPVREFANEKALLDYAEQNGLVYLWEGSKRWRSPMPAFAKRQQMLPTDQYEIVDVRTSRGVRRAMLFPILHLSYSYAPPCGPALLVTQCQEPPLIGFARSPRRRRRAPWAACQNQSARSNQYRSSNRPLIAKAALRLGDDPALLFELCLVDLPAREALL